MVNMGNCLRCCCLMLPLSWTISTFVLSIWILVGSTSTAPFPSDTYFLRMNVSMIDPPVTPPSGMTIAQYIGLHDFYQTGLWNFCEGYYRLDQDWRAVVTGCGATSSAYSFDPISIMATELKSPYTIVFVQPELDAIQAVQAAAGWHKAAFVITAIFSGFTLLIGPLTGVWHQKKRFNCLPVGTMCVASVFVFLAACTVTNVFFKLRDAFNDDARLNVQAHMGHQMFAWVWLAVWTSWTAVGQWCCAAICCPGGHRKRRVEWRRPFPGLMPLPWIGTEVRPDSTVGMILDQDAPPVGTIPVAPVVFPQPPPPPPQGQQHNYGAVIAAGLTGAAIGAAADHMHHHHHHDEQNPPPAQLPPPPPPPQVIPIAPVFNNPPPQQQPNDAPVLVPAGPLQPPMVGPDPVQHHGHGGAIAAAATAGALGIAAGAALEAHHNRPPPQPEIPPPPPPILVQQPQPPPVLPETGVVLEGPPPPPQQQAPPPAPIVIPQPLPLPQDPFQEPAPVQPPPAQQFPLTPRPVPFTPPVQMPVSPGGTAQPVVASGGAQDNLQGTFPYGPGSGMVTNSLDTLFVQEQRRQ